MSSEELLYRSGERLSFYQLFSDKRVQVEIPIIQRDYAQGRDNESEVRSTFLNALHGYLQEGKPFRDLDFVYGSVVEYTERGAESQESGLRYRFVPLDGQQRLTTLFLLHWYLAQASGKSELLRNQLTLNGRSLFTYETRNSSREFCNALMASDIDVENLLLNTSGRESVAATIRDKGWFYLSWDNDPTIRSMLTMLDAIHYKFARCGEYFDRLVSPDEPVITFLFLNLQKFNLTDDLYIKMNARGKPLSDFENFKARLEKTIKAYKEPWDNYTLKFSAKPVSGYDYFIHKVDTDWADLFWGYRNESTKDNTYDDELMNFIALVVANYQILRKDVDAASLTKSRESLFGLGGRLKRLSFMEYENLGCLTQSLLVHLMNIFDLIHREKLNSGRLTPYLEGGVFYSEEEVFKKVISNSTSYPEKLRFYAFYAGMESGKDGDELVSWVRVIFNLTENTIINTVEEYHRALRAIRDLIGNEETILEQLKKDVNVQGFSEAQIFEEKVKSHLLVKSTEWREAIVSLEGHPFFRGQIGFALRFTGIVDYYDEHGDADCVDKDGAYFEQFKRYAHSAASVFSAIGRSSGKLDYLWERAVLTKGDYLTSATANRFNLLSTRLNKNNIERDHSWRRLLRLPLRKDDVWSRRQSFVKDVFDDPNFTAGELRGSLESICSNALGSLADNDWRVLLVKMPGLFQISSQGFVVRNNNEFVILHESQRNHYHSEAYSKYLELEIRARPVDVKPFQSMHYNSARSADDYTYIELSGFKRDDGQYSMEIFYEENRYTFLFYEVNDDLCADDLVSVLDELGFSQGDDNEWEEYQNGFILHSETPQVALRNFVKLCDALRVACDE
jgi:hypothetical protein